VGFKQKWVNTNVQRDGLKSKRWGERE
jgi:hypothetical protein